MTFLSGIKFGRKPKGANLSSPLEGKLQGHNETKSTVAEAVAEGRGPRAVRGKRRWIGYLTLGCALYLSFLVALIPAGWLAWGVIKFSKGAVGIEQPQGTLWRGRGKLIVFYPRATPRQLGQTKWRIKPLWLLAARLQLRLKITGTDIKLRGTFRIGPKTITAKNTTISVPAQLIGAFYSPVILFGPKGQIRLSTDSLVLDDSGLHGDAEINWQGAGSKLSPVQPLGDYRLNIKGTGKTASLKLATTRGVLELRGQGNWNVLGDGRIQFSGSIKSRGRKRELDSILQFFGKDRGGYRQLKLNTRLSLESILGKK